MQTGLKTLRALSISVLIAVVIFALFVYRKQLFKPDHLPHVEDIAQPDQENWLRPSVSNLIKPPFGKLVVFGDSISDIGNLRARTFFLYLPTYLYWRGRLTNGPIWADYVAGALKIQLESHAIAGATSSPSGQWYEPVVLPLTEQVTLYAKSKERLLKEPAPVYVLQIGANNYLSGTIKDPQKAVHDIQESVRILADLPSASIVITTMPPLGGLPQDPSHTRPVSDAELRLLSTDHNKLIRSMTGPLQAEYPHRRIWLYDIDEANRETLERRHEFGIPHIEKPCHTGDYLGHFDQNPTFCHQIYENRYWDYTHPNSKVYCFWAIRFLKDLHQNNLAGPLNRDLAYQRCIDLKSRY